MCPGPSHQGSSGIQCIEQVHAQNTEQDNALLPKATLSLTVLSRPCERQELAQQEVDGTLPMPWSWLWAPDAFARHCL